jgi:hypothetical protein
MIEFREVDTGSNLPPVSLTPVVNENLLKIAAGVVDTGGEP